MNKIKIIAAALIAGGLVSPMAHATNGYFSHGYGMIAKGMGGAATAMAEDTFGGANNPASMVWVGNRLDVGVDWFRPIRSASRTGATDLTNGSADSDSNDFAIPEFGYNKMLDPKTSLGITVYGNGGMNTNYPGGQLTGTGATCQNFNPAGAAGAPYNMLCGTGRLGVDLMQLIVAPTAAYKINDTNSIGISPLIGYQRFRAEGLQAFSGFSADNANLTNRGYDSSTGYGVRIGWQGRMSDTITLGAAYASKMNFGKFDKYRGLFAEQGGFDIPENLNLGIAIKATPNTTVAIDYQRINYSGVNSVGNPSINFGSTTTNSLGPTNGRGFGWQDVNVVKLGVEHAYNEKMTVRAGYSKNTNPITARDVTFNILAPAVITEHYTLGFTYGLEKNTAVTMSYMHAAENSVSGSSLFNTWTTNATGTETIKMHEDSLGIAYSMKW